MRVNKESAIFLEYKDPRVGKNETEDEGTKIKRPHMNQEIQVYKSIGGWLILVAIGLILAPLRFLLALYELYPVFRFNTWDALTNPTSEIFHP